TLIPLFFVLVSLAAVASSSNTDTLFVSREGNDKWSGTLASPDARKSDGPFATLAAARDRARKLDHTKSITVFIRAGTYELPETLTFAPEDSGITNHPVTYTTFPNERVTLTGGRILKGWRKAGKLWVAPVPQDHGRWYFAQLFVNGKMQHRSWTPDTADWK